MADMSGHWEGVLIDTAGIQQRAEMDLDETAETLEGSAGLTVVDTHERAEQKAKVTGPKPTERGGESADGVEFSIALETGGQFNFHGRSGDAGAHAEAVVFGTYDVTEQGELPVSAGVAVLWRYRPSGG